MAVDCIAVLVVTSEVELKEAFEVAVDVVEIVVGVAVEKEVAVVGDTDDAVVVDVAVLLAVPELELDEEVEELEEVSEDESGTTPSAFSRRMSIPVAFENAKIIFPFSNGISANCPGWQPLQGSIG